MPLPTTPPASRPSPPPARGSAAIARSLAVEAIGEEAVARLEAAQLLIVPIAIDVEQAATLLGVHPWTIRELVKDGTLPAARVGRAIRFARDVVLAFLRGEGPSGDGCVPQKRSSR